MTNSCEIQAERNYALRRIPQHFSAGHPLKKEARPFLARSYEEEAHWQTVHGRGKSQTTVHHTRRFTNYTVIRPDTDPWFERMDALTQEGYTCFLFALRNDGYFTAEGIGLSDIIARTEHDESFRRSCAIFLPVYEHSLTGAPLVAKYQAFFHPLRGVVPIAPPQIYFEEQLTYRMRWAGTELGPLASSINLAPGESRKVALTTSAEREESSRRHATSLLDIKSAYTSDLASAIEREARSEQTRSSESSWNVKASGGTLFFSASAEASGSQRQSLTQFASSVQRYAEKASSSISKQQRTEIQTDDAARTRTLATSTTTLDLQNVNSGRTLNLFFYHLNNVFQTGLYLDDIRIVLRDNLELVEGTGNVGLKTFRLSQLDHLVAELEKLTVPTERGDVWRERMLHEFLTKMEDTLDVEYRENRRSDAEGARSANVLLVPEPVALDFGAELSRSFPRMTGESAVTFATALSNRRVSEALASVADETLGTSVLAKANRAIAQSASARFNVMELLNRPVKKGALSLPSGAFYLDALVGASPATEPYAEDVRASDGAMRDARVYREFARGFVDFARGAVVSRGARFSAPLPADADGLQIAGAGSVRLEWLASESGESRLRLHFRPVVPSDHELLLEVDSGDAWTIGENQKGQREVTIGLTAEQSDGLRASKEARVRLVGTLWEYWVRG